MVSPKQGSGTITSTEVRELLRTAAERVSSREEKVLRMRSGAGVDPSAPLPRRGQGNTEATAELLALEAELVQKLAARAQKAPQAKAAAPATARTREKDKIVRALRRLK